MQWAETEYLKLLGLVQQSQGRIREELISKFNKDSQVFVDYCNMLAMERHQ